MSLFGKLLNNSGNSFYDYGKSIAVAAGNNTITLKSTVDSATYCPIIFAKNAIGEDIGYTLVSTGVSSFVISVAEIGTIDWHVFINYH